MVSVFSEKLADASEELVSRVREAAPTTNKFLYGKIKHWKTNHATSKHEDNDNIQNVAYVKLQRCLINVHEIMFGHR